MNIPRGHSAVMAQRKEPPDSLDFFPTPPWATRALCEHVLFQRDGLLARLDPRVGGEETLAAWSSEMPLPLACWEPAAGKGHMSEVLKEYFVSVRTSDVFDYGNLDVVGSFVGEGADSVHSLGMPQVDWIITNPPFNLALNFVLQAITRARIGVAILARTSWIESRDRYRYLFRDLPPTVWAPFVERVPMVKGRWDPDASTATSYSWFVWTHRPFQPGTGHFLLIPPSCRTRLTKPDDRARFAAWSLEANTAPLLNNGAA